ncbi:RING-H2 finger protein ATL11 [Linum grandiflorum]
MDYLELSTRRILLDSVMLPGGENHTSLTLRILLTCGTFAILFAVLCFFAVCIGKCCRSSSSSAESSDQETENRNQTAAAKKRVEEVLTTFPAYTYGTDKSPPQLQRWRSCSAAAVCSICLGEYQKGECLRLLPKCGHVFHKGCIDLWLSSRSCNCPICRDQAVDVKNTEPSSVDGGVRGSGVSVVPSWNTNFGTGNVLLSLT